MEFPRTIRSYRGRLIAPGPDFRPDFDLLVNSVSVGARKTDAPTEVLAHPCYPHSRRVLLQAWRLTLRRSMSHLHSCIQAICNGRQSALLMCRRGRVRLRRDLRRELAKITGRKCTAHDPAVGKFEPRILPADAPLEEPELIGRLLKEKRDPSGDAVKFERLSGAERDGQFVLEEVVSDLADHRARGHISNAHDDVCRLNNRLSDFAFVASGFSTKTGRPWRKLPSKRRMLTHALPGCWPQLYRLAARPGEDAASARSLSAAECGLPPRFGH